MCKRKETLKLCTCVDELDTSKPYWTLSRKTIKQNEPEIVTMGIYLPPDFSFDEEFIQDSEWLEAQLNVTNCFDFEYAPLDEDELVIYLDSYQFAFVYSQRLLAWFMQEPENPFLQSVKREVQAMGYLDSTKTCRV